MKLNKDEILLKEVDFHWTIYVKYMVILLFGCTIGFSYYSDIYPLAGVIVALMSFLPLGIKYLENKCKRYVVTNQKIYIENGILSKDIEDIYLKDINNIKVEQSLLQRIFSAGDLVILTGNDKKSVLYCIEDVKDFKAYILSNKTK